VINTKKTRKIEKKTEKEKNKKKGFPKKVLLRLYCASLSHQFKSIIITCSGLSLALIQKVSLETTINDKYMGMQFQKLLNL